MRAGYRGMSLSTTLVPAGFHPTSRTMFSLPNGIRRVRGPMLGVAVTDENKRTSSSASLFPCSLHLAYDLPLGLFADPHELALHNTEYTHQIWGSRDVERPAHAIAEEGQVLLLNVTISAPTLVKIHVDIPLHLRYAAPDAGGYQNVIAKTAVGFWACPRFDG
jgi:hypothetical protein